MIISGFFMFTSLIRYFIISHDLLRCFATLILQQHHKQIKVAMRTRTHGNADVKALSVTLTLQKLHLPCKKFTYLEK